MAEVLKRCSKCNSVKPATVEYFARSAQTKDGLRYHCKECDKAYRTENEERIKAYLAEYRSENKEMAKSNNRRYREQHTEKLKAKNKEWRTANASHIKTKGLAYREKKKDEINARVRRWRKENPEKIRIKIQRRRTIKRSLPHTLTTEQWRRCLQYWSGTCAYCGRPPGLFHTICLDHVVPLSSPKCEGTTVTNCIPACHGDQGCNNIKCNRHVEVFLTEKFGPQKAAEILARINAYFDHVRANP